MLHEVINERDVDHCDTYGEKKQTSQYVYFN